MAKGSGGTGRGGGGGAFGVGETITQIGGEGVALTITRTDRYNYYGTVPTARPGTFAAMGEFMIPRSVSGLRRATEQEKDIYTRLRSR